MSQHQFMLCQASTPVEPLEKRLLMATNGLSAVYFDNAAIGGGLQQDFTGAHVARVEQTLNIDWGTGAPAAGIGADSFTARWAGRVLAPQTGTYSFAVARDGGVRLWVDDKLTIDSWSDSTTTATGSIALQAGRKYHIVLEYFENSGNARLDLRWQKPGDASATTIPASSLFSDDRRFPTGTGILDITQPFIFGGTTYQAYGNGIADDTAALRAAMAMVQNTFRGVYLPAGTYRVTDTLDTDRDRFNAKLLMLQGQNRDNTVIRLDDNLAAFQNAASPKPLFSFLRPSYSNEAFGNSAYDLTLNVGRNNPGAVGIRYAANNFGTLENVTIRAEVGSTGTRRGAVGIDLPELPGPALGQRVLVEGFDYGVRDLSGDYSMTFENLTLQQQNTAGIRAGADIMGFRNLISRNAVPVLEGTVSQLGHYTFIDSVFTGGSGNSAIVFGSPWGDATALLKNVSTSGYAKVVDYSSGTDVVGPNVSLHHTGSGSRLWSDAPIAPLDLPVQETPDTYWGDPSEWYVVDGAAADDTQAIRDAVTQANSLGRKVLVFKAGQTYTLSDTVVISGGIRRLFANQAQVMPSSAMSSSGKALFRTENLTGSDFTLDRFWGGFPASQNFHNLEQGSTVPVVLKDFSAGGHGFRNTTTGGTAFISSISVKDSQFTGGISVFARQYNPEYANEIGAGTFVLNNASKFWAFGLKTEGAGTILTTINGGKSEVYNAYLYPSRTVPTDLPAIIATDSDVSFSGANGGQSGQAYTRIVTETRGSETRYLNNNSAGVIGRGPGWKTPLFVSRSGIPNAPTGLSATSSSTTQANLAWTDTSTNETGFKIERKTGAGGAWAQIATTGAGVVTYADSGLTAGTQYSYRVRATSAAGDSAFSNEASATTQSATGGLTTSTTAPTPGPNDFSNLSGNTRVNDNDDDSVNGAGQTFRTGAAAEYRFNAVSFYVRSAWGLAAGKTIIVRIGTGVGPSFVVSSSHNFTVPSGAAAGRWFTATFASPITLSGNAQYSVQLSTNSWGVRWQVGNDVASNNMFTSLWNGDYRDRLIVASLSLPASAAGTLVTSSTTPTPSSGDAANLSGNTRVNDHDDDSVNGAGQTFSTGTAFASYRLRAVSFFVRNSWGMSAGQSITVRVGTGVGSGFTSLSSETFTVPTGAANGQWFTATFTTPVNLNANTKYSIQLQTTGWGVRWQVGDDLSNENMFTGAWSGDYRDRLFVADIESA